MSADNETLAIIMSIEKNLLFPEEVKNKLLEQGHNVVVVVPKNAKKVVMFPTSANTGIYARIDIQKGSQLTDAFFPELPKVLSKFQLKTLFTTGVCLHTELCYWEGIFEYREGLVVEDLRSALMNIKTVESVKMTILAPFV
ncbi:MAG: hypothetical protein JW776_10245 [Candidatus Lokiarchaeota archaeon]|nr:hypothetical protein [Candidatus Lokiarchaeota archaeon]